ncbi:hypothetical protein [Balneola vulgaris]|uniref:hypothetical protein n=1 Tax=Balneola vulgaris TaxID=287535 RepID=UPI0003616460|nr:hypothetical protein [Balneola vulgaris]
MKLSASHGKKISEPTDQQINQAIDEIEDNNGSFVILDAENGFVQAAGSLPDKLLVEYQIDGKHFQSISQNLSAEQVKDIFKQFRHGLNDFKRNNEWKEVELSNSGGAGCAPILLILYAVFVWQVVL